MFALAAQTQNAGTDHTPAWLAFIAAVVVALLAAITAELRQRKSLAAEAKRHEESVNGENTRHAASLNHDREMRAVDELRAVYDDACVAWAEMTNQLSLLSTALTAYCRDAVNLEPDAAMQRFDETILQPLMKLAQTHMALSDQANRLALRVGKDDASARALYSMADELVGFMESFSSSVPFELDDLPEVIVDSAGFARMRAHLEDFHVGAARYMRVPLAIE